MRVRVKGLPLFQWGRTHIPSLSRYHGRSRLCKGASWVHLPLAHRMFAVVQAVLRRPLRLFVGSVIGDASDLIEQRAKA